MECVKNWSHLIQNHLNGLSKGECFSSSIWSDNEDGRESDVQRRRDSHYGLSLLGIQLGVQAFGPAMEDESILLKSVENI